MRIVKRDKRVKEVEGLKGVKGVKRAQLVKGLIGAKTAKREQGVKGQKVVLWFISRMFFEVHTETHTITYKIQTRMIMDWTEERNRKEYKQRQRQKRNGLC